MLAQEDDQQLVERVQRGDKRAFDLLVLKYQHKILGLVVRFVHDSHEAQDVAQEAFIKAYRALGNFRGDSAFYTWLYRIAVNTAKKFLMDMRRDPVLTESALAPAQDDDETFRNRHEPSTDETPETILAAQEIAAAVQEAMAALPEELRQAVTLREIEGLSYDEIAQAMACPIGTVRSRIFRAREAISARVKPMLERQTGKRW